MSLKYTALSCVSERRISNQYDTIKYLTMMMGHSKTKAKWKCTALFYVKFLKFVGNTSQQGSIW